MQGDGVKPNYPARADGTLILTVGPVSAGTALTAEFAEKHDHPCLVVDLAVKPSIEAIGQWIEQSRIPTLNVAVPRKGKQPGSTSERWQFYAGWLSSGRTLPHNRPRL